MGTIRQGILGGFRRKTGTVIGSSWRTLDVMRALPRINHKKATPEQLEQRTKFRLVTSFVSNFDDLIELGFAENGEVATAMNRAVAYHLKNAITGVSPDFSIDLQKVKFSEGTLRLPHEVAIELEAGQKVNIAWTNMGTKRKKKQDDDKLVLMAYNPEQDDFFTVETTVHRSEMLYVLQLPPNYAGQNVHLYAAFRSALKKQLWSNTTYLGSFEIL